MAVYIGDFQSRLLLTLFYLLVAAPFGLIARIIDPLRLRPRAVPSVWLKRTTTDDTLQAARRQF
jgi:hypothetical protein